MRIIIPADLSPSVDARLQKLSSNAGGLWASTAQPFTPEKSNPAVLKATTSVSTANKSPKVAPPVLSATSNKRISTPQGSAALASFAANSDIPSAPRIPVAVNPVTSVKPVSIEPALSAAEREQILAAVKAEGENKTVEQVLQPVASKAEQAKVVEELKALAPQGTEIVDPFDGKIKLTAIQTSQSIAEQQGKELTKGFSYPKGVAENTQADSDEVKRNQGKNHLKTDSEVVVVPPKGKRSTYTVLPGDTLAVIAMKNGLNWRDVAKWNQIDPKSPLYVGTSIYLYDAKPQNTEAAVSVKTKVDSYVVQANDSLTGVANQFGLSVKQLADYNGLSVSSGLRVGQKLALKETTQTANTTDTQTVRANSSAKIKTKPYAVKRGEYLKLIADRYALSNQELADLTKGLTSGSNLLVGQKINVPLQEVEAKADNKITDKANAVTIDNVSVEPAYKVENYQVQRGDTLTSIALQSKISLTELAELNKIPNTSGLRSGQIIKIPAGSTVPDMYTVQSGDSLSAISAKYNISMNDIANFNGISRNTGLRVGQRLKLTGEETVATQVEAKTGQSDGQKSGDVHVVKSGETLSSIAKKYYLQLNYLAGLNGLSRTSSVRVGQRLKIEGELDQVVEKAEAKSTTKSVSTTAKSSKSSKNTEAYTVKSGESLNVIASRVGISVAELAALNDLNARAGLQIGQQIVIPKVVLNYKIQRGDTLIGLANRYGLNSVELAEMNAIQPNTQLRIGEVIKVPNL
jgi:LysM repeat protein